MSLIVFNVSVDFEFLSKFIPVDQKVLDGLLAKYYDFTLDAELTLLNVTDPSLPATMHKFVRSIRSNISSSVKLKREMEQANEEIDKLIASEEEKKKQSAEAALKSREADLEEKRQAHAEMLSTASMASLTLCLPKSQRKDKNKMRNFFYSDEIQKFSTQLIEAAQDENNEKNIGTT